MAKSFKFTVLIIAHLRNSNLPTLGLVERLNTDWSFEYPIKQKSTNIRVDVPHHQNYVSKENLYEKRLNPQMNSKLISYSGPSELSLPSMIYDLFFVDFSRGFLPPRSPSQVWKSILIKPELINSEIFWLQFSLLLPILHSFKLYCFTR